MELLTGNTRVSCTCTRQQKKRWINPGLYRAPVATFRGNPFLHTSSLPDAASQVKCFHFPSPECIQPYPLTTRSIPGKGSQRQEAYTGRWRPCPVRVLGEHNGELIQFRHIPVAALLPRPQAVRDRAGSSPK